MQTTTYVPSPRYVQNHTVLYCTVNGAQPGCPERAHRPVGMESSKIGSDFQADGLAACHSSGDDIMTAASPRSRRRSKAALPKKDRAERLGRMDWVYAAREALIKGGVHAVKIDLIANRLKITRGSFYWHFQNRAEVLSALIELWESQNTKPFEEIVRRPDLDAAEKYLEMAKLWLEEKDFDWHFDSAMRDWARSARAVAKKLTAIDDFRMSLFEQVFVEMGYPAYEAKVRARITYYHQVGYYTLGIREDQQARREMFPMYLRILAGNAEVDKMTID
ncbi:TetR/AcrR family transcriptional regulator [Mesorhizobium sp. NPDC059054]|uniref:TetR/AcrR family transcriptional regulator n=1 Tax=Mesorhizobium sp. NPDC059054 TaxID=3346711 RepID=UPI0036949561